MDIEENRLVKEIIEREQGAICTAIEKYGRLILYIISRVLMTEKEKQFIDDCYNDVFATLWLNIDCFDQEKGNLKSWLVGIAKYKALEYKKRCSTDKTIYMEELNYDSSCCDNYEIESNEEVMLILEALEEKDRGIFLKRYVEGYSINDIAEALGVTRDYIYNRISRGKKRIKDSLKEGKL